MFNFFLESFSEAGFVYRFPEIVGLALRQRHRFAAKSARHGGETFFHSV